MLESTFSEKGKEASVVIGYDHRAAPGLSSQSFALATASVLLHHGFKVYLFNKFVPTPFVPFAIQLKGCVAGVMITASHNPKHDNG